MKSLLFVTATLSLWFVSPLHGDLIFQESFEAISSAPDSNYGLSAEFEVAGINFFGRRPAPFFATGFDGSFGIIGQNFPGAGEASTQSVTLSGIDISTASQVETTIAFGALPGSPFINFEAADLDGLRIFAQIDGGGFSEIGRFSPDASGESNLFEDPDLDGIGTGAELTLAMQDFTFNIAGSGSTLDLRIDMTSTDPLETIAVDNVRVFAVPEPSSLLLLGCCAGWMGLSRRRRR